MVTSRIARMVLGLALVATLVGGVVVAYDLYEASKRRAALEALIEQDCGSCTARNALSAAVLW